MTYSTKHTLAVALIYMTLARTIAVTRSRCTSSSTWPTACNRLFARDIPANYQKFKILVLVNASIICQMLSCERLSVTDCHSNTHNIATHYSRVKPRLSFLIMPVDRIFVTIESWSLMRNITHELLFGEESYFFENYVNSRNILHQVQSMKTYWNAEWLTQLRLTLIDLLPTCRCSTSWNWEDVGV